MPETCTHPNCAVHGKSPCEGIRCDGTEVPTGQWAELLGPHGIDQYDMVPRGDIRPGDVVFSSHHGERTVTRVIVAGDNFETTEIVMGTWTDPTGSEQPFHERYDSHLEIPRKRTTGIPAETAGEPLPGEVEFVVQWLEDDPTTGGTDTSPRSIAWSNLVTRRTLTGAEEAARTLAQARPTRIVRRTIASTVVATYEVQP